MPTWKTKGLMSSRKQGQQIEAQVARWLAGQSLELLDSNFQGRQGEIDLIALDGEQLVFIEVRFRSHSAFGGAAASVTLSKQQKLIKTSELYLYQHPEHQHRPCRFDVIAVEYSGHNWHYEWLRSAFIVDESNYHA